MHIALMQIDSNKCDLYHRYAQVLQYCVNLSYGRWANRVQRTSGAMKNCQEIGSIVGGGSSVQCSCTITMFLLTQVEHSIIIYASRPLCNKNVARDNLSQFRTNSFQCIIFAFLNLFFFFSKVDKFSFQWW